MPNQKNKRIMLILTGEEVPSVQTQLVSFSLGLAQSLGVRLLMSVPDLLSWPESEGIHHFAEQRVHDLKLEVVSLGNATYLKKVIQLIKEQRPSLILLERKEVASMLLNPQRRIERFDRAEFLTLVHDPLLLVSLQEKVPWFESVLVPMSGEVKLSHALEWGISFANQMKLPLDLIHVTRQPRIRSVNSRDFSLIGSTCDDFYHEYPSLVSEFLSQASPYSSVREKSVIREFIHCTGLELDEIVSFGSGKKQPIAVIEWKGSLASGRSQVLRGILQKTNWSIVLVREK